MQTSISPEGAARLFAGDAPQLEMSDGRVFDVTLNMMNTNGQDQAAALIPVEIVVSEDDLLDLSVGDAARLRFHREILPDAISASVNQVLAGVKRRFVGS